METFVKLCYSTALGGPPPRRTQLAVWRGAVFGLLRRLWAGRRVRDLLAKSAEYAVAFQGVLIAGRFEHHDQLAGVADDIEKQLARRTRASSPRSRSSWIAGCSAAQAAGVEEVFVLGEAVEGTLGVLSPFATGAAPVSVDVDSSASVCGDADV